MVEGVVYRKEMIGVGTKNIISSFRQFEGNQPIYTTNYKQGTQAVLFDDAEDFMYCEFQILSRGRIIFDNVAYDRPCYGFKYRIW